ncbi:MAG: MBL fold metallo-hydrolase [Adhaeribacter sp.]
MQTLKKIMFTTLALLSFLSLTGFLILQQGTFGKSPAGERLSRIERSPNYRDGSFQNLSPTPVQAEEASFFGMLYDFFNKSKRNQPEGPIPYVQTNLKDFAPEQPAVIWFGHSSYLIKAGKKNILVDPVFSGHASPFSFLVKAFAGANHYQSADLPEIDMLVITHDHYDHLDHTTISEIKDRVGHFYAPLGVGAHLEDWGVPAHKITELDWWESASREEFRLTATPARHFSGRGLRRGKTLWTSYVLEMPNHKLYLGGDSGYDTHFKNIGQRLGPFDLAILETGQYNKNWPFIHMMPEQTVQAAKDLGAKLLFPVHLGKFALALHDWDEPLNRVVKSALEQQQAITTPMIGEPIVLGQAPPAREWWKNKAAPFTGTTVQ